MRYALMWLWLWVMACGVPPTPLKTSAELVTELVTRMRTPRITMHALRDNLDVLFTRSDAIDALIARYRVLSTDDRERWYLIRLAATAAVRGHHKAVDFLLAEALAAPDLPPTGGHPDMASDGEPLEIVNKIEAASGLVATLISDPGGADSAIQQLLQQSERWLATTAAMEMAHARVMDQQYSQIMAGRSMVSRFREMTADEDRHYTTIAVNAVSNDQIPPAR